MTDTNGNSNGNNFSPPLPGNGQSEFTITGDSAINAAAFLNELDIRREGVLGDGMSDGSNGEFARWPYGYGEPLWRLGWTDGRLGEPREKHENVIRGWCKLRGLQEIELKEERIARVKGELNSLKEKSSRTNDQLTEATGQFKQISAEQSVRYSEFSYFVAGIYLLVSLILFLSDVPLTLKLVAKGFDLKTEVLDPLTKLPILSVDDLILQPRAVAYHLWEPLALALGIAVAGVFVKIFLDELIFNDAKKTRKLAVTLCIVLGLFILAIFFLGMFRSTIQANLQSVAYRTDRDQLKARLKSQKLTDVQISDAMGPDSPPIEEGWLSVITFSALTFALPIIAGVCFAVGWRRFKDARRYSSLRKRVRKLEETRDHDAWKMNNHQAEVDAGETWLTRQQTKDNLIDAETDWAISVFQHGYYRGITLPETLDHGASLFDRVQKSAEKIFAERMRSKLWRSVP